MFIHFHAATSVEPHAELLSNNSFGTTPPGGPQQRALVGFEFSSSSPLSRWQPPGLFQTFTEMTSSGDWKGH